MPKIGNVRQEFDDKLVRHFIRKDFKKTHNCDFNCFCNPDVRDIGEHEPGKRDIIVTHRE